MKVALLNLDFFSKKKKQHNYFSACNIFNWKHLYGFVRGS